jgi:multiple sugar transport system substrate-binding protein
MVRRVAPLAIIVCLMMVGCSSHSLLDPDNPVILTVWHNYGGQMKNTMDELIDEFNATVGLEKGIILNVTSISSSSTLHENLIRAANQDPGAPELPDISTVYPKTALILGKRDLLIDIETLFSKEELDEYVPEFLEEGRLANGGLYVFPTAKSTEVLFVNKTLFNRFASDNGFGFDDLETFEGIAQLAQSYYEWTDGKTPDIDEDGKMFFMADSLFNMSLVGFRQLGDDFLKNNQLNLDSPAFSRVWDNYYGSAVKGHAAVFDGYASELARTGEIVCALGSTAGVLFYPPTVTYPNNVTEPVEYAILPYPVFEGGQKTAIQRGTGMCVTRSSEEKEYAAGVFLKWFTHPEQNLRFVSQTGYLPVSKRALESMTKGVQITHSSIEDLFKTISEMRKEYEFIILPVFDKLDKLQDSYETRFKEIAAYSRDQYVQFLRYQDANMAFQTVKISPEEATMMLLE